MRPTCSWHSSAPGRPTARPIKQAVSVRVLRHRFQIPGTLSGTLVRFGGIAADPDPRKLLSNGAGGGNRTHTGRKPHEILSAARVSKTGAILRFFSVLLQIKLGGVGWSWIALGPVRAHFGHTVGRADTGSIPQGERSPCVCPFLLAWTSPVPCDSLSETYAVHTNGGHR